MSIRSLSTSTLKQSPIGMDKRGLATVSGTTGSPTVTTDGSATIYSFTGSGSITVDKAGVVDILLVAGGGSGGVGGGGGAGGCLYLQSAYIPSGTHTITVGVGASAETTPSTNMFKGGESGTESSIGSLYVAVGGGGGASRVLRYNSTAQSYADGRWGGSGGGAVGSPTGYAVFGNSGGLSVSGQGNDGGDSDTLSYGCGGGGGAGSAGSDFPAFNDGGDGGDGRSISITGSPVTYAGGGGGSGSVNQGAGGSGGGGAAALNVSATDGTDGLGGGGGGIYGGNAGIKPGDGGTGIVIVRVGG